MERVQEIRAALVNGNGNHQEVALGNLAWRGYLLMAAPVAASWAGLVDGPAAALLAFALLLLLGVGLVSLAMLAPRQVERVHEDNENRAEVNDDGDNYQGGDGEAPDAGSLAWCGHLLVAAPVAASWFGLADEPGAAFLAFALLLLGFGFISLAMLAPAKLKTLWSTQSIDHPSTCQVSDLVVFDMLVQ